MRVIGWRFVRQRTSASKSPFGDQLFNSHIQNAQEAPAFTTSQSFLVRIRGISSAISNRIAGSSVNQRGLQYGSPFATTETGSRMGVQELSCERHLHSNFCIENSRKLSSQVGPSRIDCHRTFVQSAVPLAKNSLKETSGKKKRGGKTAAEVASHNAATQMRPIVFECTACTAICVSRILKDPYDRGVTILRCMDCRSVNLISDQLGLFKEPGSMQRFLKDRGVDVINGSEGRYELTPEDLARTQPQEASTA